MIQSLLAKLFLTTLPIFHFYIGEGHKEADLNALLASVNSLNQEARDFTLSIDLRLPTGPVKDDRFNVVHFVRDWKGPVNSFFTTRVTTYSRCHIYYNWHFIKHYKPRFIQHLLKTGFRTCVTPNFLLDTEEKPRYKRKKLLN